MKKIIKTKKPHEHLIPVFFAIILGISMSYYLISFATHPTSAALSLLKYISADRTVAPPLYPLCPQLVKATYSIGGTNYELFHDRCTGLHWTNSDAALVHDGQTGYTWSQAKTQCQVMKGKTCRLSPGTSCSVDADCGADAPTGSCGFPFRLPSPDELLSLNNVPCGELKQCNNITAATRCSTDADCNGVSGSCQIQACSPILRPTSGFYAYNTVPNQLVGDGAYWTAGEQNLDPTLNDPQSSSNGNETGVSVNLKWGVVNNPALGKNIQLPVRCIYNLPNFCPDGEVLEGISCVPVEAPAE